MHADMITYTGASGVRHTVPFRPVYGGSEDVGEEVDDLDFDLDDEVEPEAEEEVDPKPAPKRKGKPDAAMAAMRKRNRELEQELVRMRGNQSKPEPKRAAQPDPKPQPTPKPSLEVSPNQVREQIQAARVEESFHEARGGILGRHPEFALKDKNGRPTESWDPKWVKKLDPLLSAMRPTGPRGTYNVEDLERCLRADDDAFAILNTKNARNREAKVIASTHGNGPQGSRVSRSQGSPDTPESARDLIDAHYNAGDRSAGEAVKNEFRTNPKTRNQYGELLKLLHKPRPD